ncbi:hypothetical protein ACFU53_44500 [Streptomyces sp. NPDC057474]|uniref:hypothetical protein n=1 Tax=Streptomyces sp. NPDC057474 TaxID=3346144 RepID=UPI0036BA3E88
METLVEGAVTEALRDGGDDAIRLYAAACAERMAPLFVGLRAGAPGREADLDFYAESVRDLWHADRPLANAAEGVRQLERFPELQPNEEGITDVADTYAFVAEHGPYQLQSDRKGDLGPVVVAGEVGREEPAEAMSPIRRLHAEVDETGDCGLADLQPIDARGLREGGDRREVRGFDRPMVTDRLLGTSVVAVFVTVGGVVLGDPVDEGRRHVAPCAVKRGASAIPRPERMVDDRVEMGFPVLGISC